MALGHAQVLSRASTSREAQPGSEAIKLCDLVILNASANLEQTSWLRPNSLLGMDRPLLLLGSREHLYTRVNVITKFAQDLLLAPPDLEEFLLRAYRLISSVRERAYSMGLACSMRESCPMVGPAVPAILRVVIADDDPAVIMLIKHVLANLNIECHVAADGMAALVAVRSLMPDLVLLDIGLPILDGLGVLSSLREDPGTRSVPVALLTASDQKDDLDRGLALHADDYIIKPVSPVVLAARLKRLLRRSLTAGEFPAAQASADSPPIEWPSHIAKPLLPFKRFESVKRQKKEDQEATVVGVGESFG